MDSILTRIRRNKSRPNVQIRTTSYNPYLSDDDPGRPAQGILQVPLVEFQRQGQQVVGIVQKLPPIDFGTDYPLLPARNQRLGRYAEHFARRTCREVHRVFASAAQIFEQQHAFAQHEIRLDEALQPFGCDQHIGPVLFRCVHKYRFL